MSTELQGMDVTFKAAADLSALQFRIMKLSAANKVNKATAAADKPLVGVLQDKPDAADKAATVRTSGISKLVAGGTIAAGDLLTSDANGDAVAAAPAVGVNNGIVGYAIDAAVDNDIFRAMIAPSVLQGA